VECEYKNGKPTTDLNQLFNKYWYCEIINFFFQLVL
jgi:hypothetical protein